MSMQASATSSRPIAASLPLPGGSTGATVRLHPLLCGSSLAPPAWPFRHQGRGAALRALGIGVPRSEWLQGPIGAFAIEHPSAGPILVDTGLHSSTPEDLKQNFGRVNAYFFRTLQTSREQCVPRQLQARGIDPAEITLVLMTHLHVDHASAMTEIPNATFVCSKAEWQAANARFGVWRGYVRRQLPPAARVRTIDFQAQRADPPFSHAVDLFGDGAVKLIYTPGHSKGHISVLVRLATGDALLAGDAIYTLRNLREDILPWRTVDDATYRQSMSEIRAYTAQHSNVLLMPTHDGEAWEGLDDVY